MPRWLLVKVVTDAKYLAWEKFTETGEGRRAETSEGFRGLRQRKGREGGGRMVGIGVPEEFLDATTADRREPRNRSE